MTTPAEIFSRLSAEISSASFVAGCIDTLGILAFIESLRSGRQRLLGVAALAAALFLAILAYQLGPESVMAAFCISLTFAGLLLHLRAQSHGAVHFPRLDLAIPLLAGAGVVASLLPPSSAGGATTALAPALFLLAAPITLVVAAKNLVVDRPHGEWTLFATAGYTGAAALQLATKMRFTDGVPGFIFNAGVLMLSLLALYLGEIAALRPQPSDQQAPMNAATDRTSIDNEAQARLFSQLSHELRSPLGVVLAGLGNLRRSNADPANDKRLGRMTQAAQRISNTLDDYSTLLDPQSGAGPLNLVAISPEFPAQSALRIVQRDNPERFLTTRNVREAHSLSRWMRTRSNKLSPVFWPMQPEVQPAHQPSCFKRKPVRNSSGITSPTTHRSDAEPTAKAARAFPTRWWLATTRACAGMSG